MKAIIFQIIKENLKNFHCYIRHDRISLYYENKAVGYIAIQDNKIKLLYNFGMFYRTKNLYDINELNSQSMKNIDKVIRRTIGL